MSCSSPNSVGAFLVGVPPASRSAAESMAFRWAEPKHRFGMPFQSPRQVFSPANRFLDMSASFPLSFIHEVEFDGSQSGRDARFGSPCVLWSRWDEKGAMSVDVDAESWSPAVQTAR